LYIYNSALLRLTPDQPTHCISNQPNLATCLNCSRKPKSSCSHICTH